MDPHHLNTTLSEGNTSQTSDATFGVGSHYSYVEEPQVSRIIRYVIYAVLFVFAMVGNATVCIIPFRHKRMRNCTYFLVTNLAVSDIGTMLCLPYVILEWRYNEWILGEAMCKLVYPSLTMFYLVTTNTLLAIAVHRFLMLVFPFRSKPSKSKAGLVILLTWLVAFFCVLPSFGARTLDFQGRKQSGEIAYRCIEIFPGKTEEEQAYYKNIYDIFQYIINICLPIVIIVLLYLAIAYKLRQMSTAFGSFTSTTTERRESAGTMSSPQSTASGSRFSRKTSLDHYYIRERNQLENRFLRMLAVVVAIFVICYVPYTTFFLVVLPLYPSAYDWRYLLIFYHYIYLLMWFPNALNPICYGALDEHYKKAFKALCCARKKSHSSAGRHAENLIPKNYRWFRTNTTNTMPPIMEHSNSQAAGNLSGSDSRKGTGKKRWKVFSSK
ncbi:kappa-type opioid receptor-like [Montipora foliosa]|uniref:kappa-type opioid receptor-like n=1 Tax=Montipora foliosa TaxID=591990 RepID=UPI0035F1A9EA